MIPANLDQLTLWLPGIMLVFIPAITMSIWAEEKRQGTDELLLTIPAGDFDIVVGKYLAAACIFTCSLLFSLLTSFLVLNSLALGDVDVGLFMTTYLGYWLVGLMMLALGMVASFLTSNLTVGFILGALFNVPLVGLVWADTWVAENDWARALSRWSVSAQLEDFSRGVISLSSVSYFVLIAAVGVYLSMVLIGRRHWLGGRDGDSMLGHYFLRTICLVVVAFALNATFSSCDSRCDATDGKVSSLSPDTKRLMRELDPPHTIEIEAFISSSLPDILARTRFELISMLRELDVAGGNKVRVRIHDDLELFDAEAVRAEEVFDIEPVMIQTEERGAISQEEVILGAVFSCGKQRNVTVPFFSAGVPVEYELIRSVETVADEERKKIGVAKTDAELFGSIDFMSMPPQPRGKQLILDELEKQYDVEEVDLSSPIESGMYDVLLVVQPSSLPQPQLDNLIDAIQEGQPTAIFEDPAPYFIPNAPGTSEPRRPRGGMMMQQQPPEPKGDIQQLWDLLGVEFLSDEGGFSGSDSQVVWQQFNPYPKIANVAGINSLWVFASPDAPGAKQALNEDNPIVSGMSQLLMLRPGGIKESNDPPEGLTFEPLVTTGDRTGTIKASELRTVRDDETLETLQEFTGQRYILSAFIKEKPEENESGDAGKEKGDAGKKKNETGDEQPADNADENQDAGQDKDADQDQDAGAEKDASEEKKPATDADGDDKAKEEPADRGIRVVLTTDIDVLASPFVNVRAFPDATDINFRFDNVPFVLNILDFLAKDDRFLEIRKRELRHSSLRSIEQQSARARDEANKAIEKAREDSKKSEEEAETQRDEAIAKIKEQMEELQKKYEEDPDSVDLNEVNDANQLFGMREEAAQNRERKRKEEIQRELKAKLEELDREVELQVREIRMWYKLWAVILPPIPPLIVAFVVFMRRRLREREGVTRSRLR